MENVLAFSMTDKFWITVGYYPSSLREYRDKNTKETRFIKIFKQMMGQLLIKENPGPGFSEE